MTIDGVSHLYLCESRADEPICLHAAAQHAKALVRSENWRAITKWGVAFTWGLSDTTSPVWAERLLR